MRLLLDTNIIIDRESDKVVQDKLRKLIRICNDNGVVLTIHPSSKSEIKRSPDFRLRDIRLSKLATYSELRNPPEIIDKTFISALPSPKNENDLVDNQLLYCVYKSVVDILVTEDKEILKKAEKLVLGDRAYSIEEAFGYLSTLYTTYEPTKPLALQEVPAYSLNLEDPIFDELKKKYKFTVWWQKISKEHRSAYVLYLDSGLIGALLILKIEDENLVSEPPLNRSLRLKICTFIVSHVGHKLGELLLKVSIDFAVKNNISQIYLTHFDQESDYLVNLIKEYGFLVVAKMRNESVYLKNTMPVEPTSNRGDIRKIYYPSYYDGDRVRKHIVPIIPEYYQRLFEGTESRQLTFEDTHNVVTERNTILKAYISHTYNTNIKENDVILIYRTDDIRSILAVGTIDRVAYGLTDLAEVETIIGKRTVFSSEEIKRLTDQATTVLLFRHHFYLKNPITYKFLRSKAIIDNVRTIKTISNDKYVTLKRVGGIDERYTVH